jgi:hypothetical protein
MTRTHSPRRLTEGYVKSLSYKTRAFAVRDTAVKGLLVDINKLSKSYKVQKELWVGQRGRRRLAKTVRRTLGTTDEMTLDEARTLALALVAEIKRGKDPNGSFGDIDAGQWTVERMFAEYVADMARRECAERSGRNVLERLERYLRDRKKTPISEIKKSIARERHALISRRNGKRIAKRSRTSAGPTISRSALWTTPTRSATTRPTRSPGTRSAPATAC